jgi:hypothetical protein
LYRFTEAAKEKRAANTAAAEASFAADRKNETANDDGKFSDADSRFFILYGGEVRGAAQVELSRPRFDPRLRQLTRHSFKSRLVPTIGPIKRAKLVSNFALKINPQLGKAHGFSP